MKTSEIRELTLVELEERIEQERDALHRMRMNHAISPLENPMQLRSKRKEIARLLTIKREKEILASKSK